MNLDDAKYTWGDFVQRKIRPGIVGQVVAIIWAESGVGYRVQWTHETDEHCWYELTSADEPSEQVFSDDE